MIPSASTLEAANPIMVTKITTGTSYEEVGKKFETECLNTIPDFSALLSMNVPPPTPLIPISDPLKSSSELFVSFLSNIPQDVLPPIDYVTQDGSGKGEVSVVCGAAGVDAGMDISEAKEMDWLSRLSDILGPELIANVNLDESVMELNGQVSDLTETTGAATIATCSPHDPSQRPLSVMACPPSSMTSTSNHSSSPSLINGSSPSMWSRNSSPLPVMSSTLDYSSSVVMPLLSDYGQSLSPDLRSTNSHKDTDSSFQAGMPNDIYHWLDMAISHLNSANSPAIAAHLPPYSSASPLAESSTKGPSTSAKKRGRYNKRPIFVSTSTQTDLSPPTSPVSLDKTITTDTTRISIPSSDSSSPFILSDYPIDPNEMLQIPLNPATSLFHCPIPTCPYNEPALGFQRRYNLKLHYMTHLDYGDFRDYECLLCGQSFRRKFDCRRHVEMVHKVEMGRAGEYVRDVRQTRTGMENGPRNWEKKAGRLRK
jgi:uncharacterized C2H2 Zn-finger protein